jgi:hypothetical protein
MPPHPLGLSCGTQQGNGWRRNSCVLRYANSRGVYVLYRTQRAPIAHLALMVQAASSELITKSSIELDGATMTTPGHGPH